MHWVIGDVHGMLRPLQRLLDAVFADDAAAKLIFAGDYVNRGPDSFKVIDLLISLTNTQFVRGNHDDIFDLILHGHSYAESAASASPVLAFSVVHGLRARQHVLQLRCRLALADRNRSLTHTRTNGATGSFRARSASHLHSKSSARFRTP